MPFIKHVFKYQEYRRTQFLNTMAKDDLGRHRGGVLYGMKLIPKGTSVQVDAGALYTPYGSKIFWDARPADLGPSIGVVDLSAVLLNGTPVLQNVTDRPIIVAVVAQFPSDMQNAADTPPSIEGSDDLAGAVPPVTFAAYASSYQQDTARPGFNLFSHHPLELAASGVPGWSVTDAGSSGDDLTTAGGPAQRPAATPGSNAAVQINQILIGYIIIGGIVGSTPLDLGTDVWAPGVTYVPVKNPWQTLQTLLGLDPLMGRTPDLVDGGVAEPLDPTTGALSQVSIARKMATAASYSGPPLGVPRFGTTGVGPGGFDQTWSTYRFPNFMRDGDSILDALRRMDYILRLWMDKTGDQGLIRSVQDGAVSGPTTYLKRFESLEGILYQMGGKVTGNNLNTANWGGDNDLPLSIGGDPFAATVATLDGDTVYDHVLKSGVLTHTPQQLDLTTMEGAGDTHRQAIRALDWSMFHFLKDILGIDIRRSWLRLQGAWTSQALPAWTDLPAGLPVDNTGKPGVQSGFPLRPAIFVSGALGGLTAADFNLYLGVDKIKAAVENAERRTSAGASPNLLKNPVFAKGGTVTSPGSPMNWSVDVASTWGLVPNPGTGEPRRLVATLHDYCRQYVGLTTNLELLGAILDCGVLSLSVSLAQMSAGEVLYVGLKLLDNIAPGPGVNDLLTAGGYVRATGTSESDGYTTFTFAVKLPTMRNADGTATAARTTLMSLVRGIGIEIINPDGGGSPKSISIAGAHLGAGLPPMLPMANQDYYEFLSRDGGPASKMRGPLEMGNQDINDVKDLHVNHDATVTGRTTTDGGFTSNADSSMAGNKLQQVGDAANDDEAINKKLLIEHFELTADDYRVQKYNTKTVGGGHRITFDMLVGRAVRALIGNPRENRYFPTSPTAIFCACECENQCTCQCQCNGECNDRSHFS